MSLPSGNPRFPEGINASAEHPLKEFVQLVAAVAIGLVALVVVLSLAARWLAPYIPFSWEQSFSPAVAAAIVPTDETEDETQDAVIALQSLAQAILATSLTVPFEGRAGVSEIPPDAFNFHLVSADMPNAFATLGATIMVTRGLPRHVSSENGLAMVLAHEIAHVQLRHPIEAAGRGVIIQIALAALLGQTANSLLGGAINTGGALTLLSFSRDMERAADERALKVLQQHYGHLGGADEFFQSMDAADDVDEWLEFVQTHPDTRERIARIREAISESGGAGRLTPLPKPLQTAETSDE